MLNIGSAGSKHSRYAGQSSESRVVQGAGRHTKAGEQQRARLRRTKPEHSRLEEVVWETSWDLHGRGEIT